MLWNLVCQKRFQNIEQTLVIEVQKQEKVPIFRSNFFVQVAQLLYSRSLPKYSSA